MSDTENEVEIKEELTEVMEEKPRRTTFTKSRGVSVTWFREMKGYCLCEAEDGTGYKVPSELCPDQTNQPFEIQTDDERIETLYNWDKEIKAMLPDQKALIRNIRKALWHNGAISKESAQENSVQKNLMRGAFPYRITIEEE